MQPKNDNVKVDLELIQKLRERTNCGMLDCKKALIESNGDLDKAVEYLRKKGSAVAAKRSDNATAEGLVHAYIHAGSRLGVLLELNCETDFVARTEAVKQFAHDVCMHIAAARPLYLNPEQVDPKMVEKEMDIYREQLVASGKPEKIIDQIVQGKMAKFYSEVCLLNQQFIKNDQLTIDELLKELIGKVGENIRIKRFARFEVGVN
ncbi:translation elongation factor Ts [Vermiphilus pyriformis]|jgi:elongation factor Ts|uniref:Elongation factor Ts n=1 Tax=candidate division TM6 bacterium JCVI TM6SC1 TaxID=1306947 RepID=A0A0D2GQP1_9BACT|nr:elongation factor Ts [candidate division TM6 bacterium JCVI TM6SC1]UNE35628.1 MAG: translation elongation factor Ts [Vermiphilus pyriformis]